ncbi:hypothetical protein BCY91_05150 [Pelobium manganitolerans]|uniref:Prevent-host-death protein n=1 Tax=Pelobium manganitolerans TaxID=1842495 RepID=A0A419S5X6_9SPHI|nr:DUF2683 family protein [Pelobium manganitolerans]RKD16260.1 hypothetical protein BCY91_05150 [Pelobium manganitolerans]
MENIIVTPKNESQLSAIKNFLKEMKVSFKTEKKDDTLLTEEEFYDKIDASIKEAKEGKVKVVNTKEELNTFLKSL